MRNRKPSITTPEKSAKAMAYDNLAVSKKLGTQEKAKRLARRLSEGQPRKVPLYLAIDQAVDAMLAELEGGKS